MVKRTFSVTKEFVDWLENVKENQLESHLCFPNYSLYKEVLVVTSFN